MVDPNTVNRRKLRTCKTAKMHDRHFVQHNYHDHANDPDDTLVARAPVARQRGGVTLPFPLKLHQTLEQVERDGYADCISWQPHGRCFVIHKPKQFVDEVMPRYFNQTKLTSFQRQLNLYGFVRLTRGPDANGYYHEYFLRGRPFLTKHMVRTRVKGTKIKGASSPDQEPDFYTMPPVTPHPVSPTSFATTTTSQEESSHYSSDDYSIETSTADEPLARPEALPNPTKSCSLTPTRPPLVVGEFQENNNTTTTIMHKQPPSIPTSTFFPESDELSWNPNANSSDSCNDAQVVEQDEYFDHSATTSHHHHQPCLLDPVDEMIMELHHQQPQDDPLLSLGLLNSQASDQSELVKVLESDYALGRRLDQILNDTLQW